jgi:hypothetical protein
MNAVREVAIPNNIGGNMTLIKTSDGLFSWRKDGKSYEFTTKEFAVQQGFALLSTDYQSLRTFTEEFERAVNLMNDLKHDIAEFGIFGTFIFSMTEEEYESVFQG